HSALGLVDRIASSSRAVAGDQRSNFSRRRQQKSKIKMMGTRRRGSQAEEEDEETLLEAFRIFDRDNKGYIDRWDILRVVRMLGERLSRREIQAMMAEADRDNNGRVEFAEFAAMLQMEKNEIEAEGGEDRR
ncbi:hypothetical protein PRIPAC_87375, partial [Pristionchus pacificus]|uniref:EF-hand domain-containing protein n=1 Tax=Pristionchus pacificus TaxID=54126 RepID=A0A8R1Z7U7_PRIPA